MGDGQATRVHLVGACAGPAVHCAWGTLVAPLSLHLLTCLCLLCCCCLQGVLLDQNNNPANPAAHEATTGVEVWRQTGGTVTHFMAGMGTSGTLVGCARALKARNPAINCIGLEPPAEEATAVPGIRRWPREYYPKVGAASVETHLISVPV